jgi:hypothetical protein
MPRFSHWFLSWAKGTSGAQRVGVLLPLAFGLLPLAVGLLPVVIALAQTPAASQVPAPAQLPLRNLAQPPVKPNLMVMLDDSSSMGQQSLFEGGSAKVGSWTVTLPSTGRMGALHPSDVAVTNMTFSVGLVPSDRQPLSWQQRAMRSPDVNSLYYNPETRYRPTHRLISPRPP